MANKRNQAASSLAPSCGVKAKPGYKYVFIKRIRAWIEVPEDVPDEIAIEKYLKKLGRTTARHSIGREAFKANASPIYKGNWTE